MSQPMLMLLLKASGETVLMVVASGLIGHLVGIPLGICLFVTRAGMIREQPALHRVLGLGVNIGRSLPFIILLVAIIPFTRMLVGTFIGTMAAVVPLAIATVPFVARLVDGALLEVPGALVEAAASLGARPVQIVWRVLLPEALPGLCNGATITLVALVGYSAMAGAVGGGGLGDLGIRYGYQRFDSTVMAAVVLVLVALVQLIQTLGDRVVRAVDRRN